MSTIEKKSVQGPGPRNRYHIRPLRIAVVHILFLCLAGCKPEPPEWMTDPGAIIYMGYKDTFASCARCHGAEGEGRGDGPEIRNAITELGRAEVRDIIRRGKKGEDKDMPAFAEDFTAEEIEQILDFLTHWNAGEGPGSKGGAASDSAAIR